MSSAINITMCLLWVGLMPPTGTGAQAPRERPRLVLQALDTDHDGTLNPAEIEAAPSVLRSMDRNGDGELTFDELEPPRVPGVSPDEMVTQLMMFDRNGDGVLTVDELPERLHPMLLRGDTNHDGKLTPDEIRAMARRNSVPGGRRGVPGSASGMMRQDALLNALDTDHDGVISAGEMAAAKASLLSLDVNHDGLITPDEMRVRQQTPAERAAHVLEEFDANKDGRLSLDEVPDGLRAGFASADTNHDGFLDGPELQEMFSTQQSGTSNAPSAQPAHALPKSDAPPKDDASPKGMHD